MLDFAHLPGRNMTMDRQVYMGNHSSILASTFVWTRPRAATMIMIAAVGQGGKGADGGVGATAAGGVGGGSGAINMWWGSIYTLPETMYITCGGGGIGTNLPTMVATRGYNATYNSNPGTGELLAGSGGAPGNSGTAGSIATVQSLSGRGRNIVTIVGDVGQAGGTTSGTAGTSSIHQATGGWACAGAGGGGMSGTVAGAGGNVTQYFQGRVFGLTGGAPGTSGVNGGQGQHAAMGPYTDLFELGYSQGGAGGGAGFPSATASNGGNGGNAGPGGGGGGGGAAVTGKTAGVGGRGGPGFVIIWTW